ncbi:cell division protein ZipA [Sulfuriflexus sp.]|uniref:cell division protein ZipA n=1 Tax=Sulfuriflexus sp. TaxID=2015443 RepID=UPI0028CCA952|nr:cell division protein ZipA [Sulfuriflexus sp.]MDT8403018.1 cell division protein ZipA [Sulfuriflexus sp.]
MDSLRISLILLGAVLILAFYLWERIRRRREDDRYQRWGGVREEGTETHVVSARQKSNLHDDLGDIESFSTTDSPLSRPENDAYHRQEPDLESDPELDNDPIYDIRGELEALEEIITATDADAGQMDIGDFDVNTDSRGEQKHPQPEEPAEPERIIALHVLSQEGQRFNGADLLHAFMQVGLQYGEMNIFHRLQEGSDMPVFSLANAIEPGYFELATMAETSTPALLLLMTLPHRLDALAVFDDMLDTARKLADELHGRLCDDHRSVLTRQAIDDLRASLNTYVLNKSLAEQSR